MEEGYKIPFDTSIDTKNLEKGLTDAITKAENEVIKATQKQTEAVYKAAKEQIDIIRETESEKVAEVKKGVQEQIAAIKAMPDLSGTEKQKQIKAVKEAADQEIKIIKDKAKLSETVIRNMADKQIKTYNDLAKKQIKAIQDANKSCLQSIKDFAKGATSELLGIDQVLGTLAGGPVAIGKAFVNAGKQVVSALNEWANYARESIRVQETLRAVIKSTGAESWVTASTLNKLARDQSAATGRSKDEIAQMQAVLLGFRSVTKDVFGDATSAVLDMAQVMGGDLRSSANMLGKALDAPVQGMSALSRVGFVFTEQQKEMIKRLEETGDHLAAQKIILGEVQAAFSGAASTTSPAIQAQLKYNNAIEEFKKQMGEGWAKAISALQQGMADAVQSIVDANNKIKDMKEAQAEVAKLNEDQQKRITALEKERNKVISERYDILGRQVMSGEKLVQNIERVAEIDKKIQDIRKEAIDQNIESQAGLHLLELQYNEALEKREDLQKRIYAAELASRDKRAGDMTNTINLLKRTQEENEILISQLDEQIKKVSIIAEAKTKEAQAETDRQAAEQKRLNDQAEAARLREENKKALDEEIKKIYLRAEIEGKSKDDITVRKQILDAEVHAYENLLTVAKEYLDGTAPEEKAQLARLKERWRIYSDAVDQIKRTEEEEKRADEERKKRLTELTKEQDDLQSKLAKILEDAQSEWEKLYDTQKEKTFQDALAVLRKDSVEDAIKYEAEYRQHQRQLEYDKQLEAIDKNEQAQRESLGNLKNAELEAAGDNAALKLEITEKYNKDVEELDKKLVEARNQLDANFQEERRQAEKETAEAIAKAHEDATNKIWDDYLQMWRDILAETQKYLDAITSIAGDISTIWKNNIDYETNAKLKANDKMIQSDEERAIAEKKIMIEAAYKRYEADLFNWAANATLATAQAAMAVLNALSNPPGPPYTIPMAALATAAGAMQVAAVISARPKPPRFHSGGTVQGSGDVPAVLKAGEAVLTQRQFQNTMQAISNLAGNKTGSGAGGLVVNIHNEASDKVTATPRVTPEGLEVVIEGIVNKGFEDGTFDRGIAMQQSHSRGRGIL